jgi:hypothetical protein
MFKIRFKLNPKLRTLLCLASRQWMEGEGMEKRKENLFHIMWHDFFISWHKKMCVCIWGCGSEKERESETYSVSSTSNEAEEASVKAWKELNDTDIFGSYENNQANTTNTKGLQCEKSIEGKCDVCVIRKRNGEGRFICAHCMTWWRRGSCCDFFPPLPRSCLLIYLPFLHIFLCSMICVLLLLSK